MLEKVKEVEKMKYTLEEKFNFIHECIIKENSTNPIEIVKNIMHKEFINMHGPEHHFLDGASFLVAYRNCNGKIDLNNALAQLKERAIKMPGAMCGYWGICGSTASIGAALSIIHQTGPLSDNDFYKEHMEYTSSVIDMMSKLGGPRCCKRNAFLSLSKAANFVERKYNINMKLENTLCEFSSWNKQCIKEKCPYFKS